MDHQAKAVSRPWRRYLRFSVRGLIVLVFVVSAWMGWVVRSVSIQREAVTAIRNTGGNVSYEWEWWNRIPLSGGKHWTPRWLVDLIGVDYFVHVTGVATFSATPVVLAKVGRLSRLESLGLSPSTIDEEGLAHLEGLNNLVYLDLGGTRVTDAGIVRLCRLTKLTALSLAGTKVTDAGIKELQRALPRLTIHR